MQGKQNMSSTERKGPHKSMHCKFCKPPGVVTPEKPTGPQMETKTKIHLAHEAADLRLCNTHNEPGSPAVESEACVCVLEGENSCPKCVPDKNRPPPKKKVCRCPKGAKPHPSMYNETAPKKKKMVEEDNEFWWEKYSREHDALAKETWAAYMAQRRKDKKLEKCQKKEREAVLKNKLKGAPSWYQKLSCQQMIYVEYLSTAIRLDSDENITDRTHFVLGGIGLYPRPKRKVLKRCLRFCHYNSIQFLNQLHILIKDEDPFREKAGQVAEDAFTWNERLIMNSMCYLEFPAFLRELMDRLPPLPRTRTLPQIPYPVFPVAAKKKYDSPYQEPIWQDRLNWVEKMKIDRLNRCRLHMETKRVKIPSLALVRRPSLIDARPPFLAQIEANERASRRLVEEKKKKPQRKHPISTFNSAVDVTAIAGIEASEISTTDKADTDDICVFLREPKGGEYAGGEGDAEEEPDFPPDKEVKFLEEPPKLETQVDRIHDFSDLDDYSEEGGEGQADDMPFKTPPKTESGATIASPCPPPDATPGPPASHYDRGKRELDINNEEICRFFPFVSASEQTVKEDAGNLDDDVELNLRSAAEKLRKFADEDEGEGKKTRRKGKKPKKKEKCQKKARKGKCKKAKPRKRRTLVDPDAAVGKKNEEAEKDENQMLNENDEEEEEEEEEHQEEEEEEEEKDGMQISFKIEKGKEKKGSQRDSDVSDPDPDTEDEWSARPPCLSDAGKSEEKSNKKNASARRKTKRKHGKSSIKKSRKKEPGEKSHTKKQKAAPGRRKAGEARMQDESKAKAKEAEKQENKAEVFTGEVEPLVKEIIKDLAEEGFNCASYPLMTKHPDVDQLILYLKGEMVNAKLRNQLRAATKLRWSQLKGVQKFLVSDLGIPPKRSERADWNDKKWISRLAKSKTDQFYYKVANSRVAYATEFYSTLYQSHFGTERYLKIFYAYMPSKYEDCILRGII